MVDWPIFLSPIQHIFVQVNLVLVYVNFEVSNQRVKLYFIYVNPLQYRKNDRCLVEEWYKQLFMFLQQLVFL